MVLTLAWPMREPVSCECEQKPRAQAKASARSKVVSLGLAAMKRTSLNRADTGLRGKPSGSAFDFEKELLKNIQSLGLREAHCEALFDVLVVWENLEWTQHLTYIAYVAEHPDSAIERITKIFKVLHSLSEMGFLMKRHRTGPCYSEYVKQQCKICGGPGCNWCNKEKWTLPLDARGNPMNKEFMKKRGEAKRLTPSLASTRCPSVADPVDA